MTTELDELFGDLAVDLLDEYGATAILYPPNSESDFDQETAAQDTSTTGPYTVKVSPPEREVRPLDVLGIDPGNAPAGGMVRTILAQGDPGLPSGFVPDGDCWLAIGSRKYKVVRVFPYDSGDETAAWELVLAGSGVA